MTCSTTKAATTATAIAIKAIALQADPRPGRCTVATAAGQPPPGLEITVQETAGQEDADPLIRFAYILGACQS